VRAGDHSLDNVWGLTVVVPRFLREGAGLTTGWHWRLPVCDGLTRPPLSTPSSAGTILFGNQQLSVRTSLDWVLNDTHLQATVTSLGSQWFVAVV
jgi:hypothetical protein